MKTPKVIKFLPKYLTRSRELKLLLRRLRDLSPLIKEICKIAGTPGLSLGVLHHGEVIYLENLGYRDVEAKLPPTSDTIYHIASLSKAFASAAMGILVEEGKASWDTPVKNILPEFQNVSDNTISEQTTITDLLSHRTGLASKNHLWIQGGNKLLLDKAQTIATFNYMECIKPLRSQWIYNNFAYALIGEIIERLTGESYGSFVTKKILEPLGLSRTIIGASPPCENLAEAYMPLDDGSPVPIPRPEVQDGTIMSAASGVRSSVKDLLIWSKAVMASGSDQFSCNSSSTPKSPLKQMSTILATHVAIEPHTFLESSSALGWVRTQLPGVLGGVGYNGMVVNKPVACRGSKSRLAIHHQGSLPGFASSIHLFPETQTSIVVLTNSLGICDSADWVGQLIAEALFDTKKKNDYVQLARESAKGQRSISTNAARELERDQTKGTSHKPLTDYVGRYYNMINNFFIEVDQQGEGLYMSFQGLKSETYNLRHYHNDVFSWYMTRDEAVKRGRFTFFPAEYYKIKFRCDGFGKVDRLIWAHEPGIPKGETFTRRVDSPAIRVP